ncbi:hypothetical protein CFC21_093809 [Triticum aestivum]|uniref:KIB1-4 beta-propeller domain-containing protein n=2 Tax=Triticum aestivum TaxID=4565 RepID=A0A3B6QKP2_WHEAT|nr:hypothetical protein CFC21_093809 [Triticum aestivum]
MSRWQSAPADIICDIGDSLLDSNCHDSYVAMRYVCSLWKSAISSYQRLFLRAHRWIVLEEINEFGDCTVHRVFVNLSTGRMVKRRIPLLNDHVYVGSSDGLLILVEKNEPYFVKLWEPFTGYLVQFTAGIIHQQPSHFAVETRGVPRLFHAPGGLRNPRVMCYDVNNGNLEVRFGDMPVERVASMTAYKSDVFVLFHNRQLFKITGDGHEMHGEFILIHEAPALAPSAMTHYLVVSGGGNLLILVIGIAEILIFCVDVELRTAVRIYNIGSQALFLSNTRCISVNAESFPTVRENCVYQACISGYSGPCGTYEFSLMRPRKRKIYHQSFVNDVTYTLGGRPLSMCPVLIHYCLFRNKCRRPLS